MRHFIICATDTIRYLEPSKGLKTLVCIKGSCSLSRFTRYLMLSF